MISDDSYTKLIQEIKVEFSDFEIIPKKDSKLMKTIDVILKTITFGKMKHFQTNFTTTLGNKIYTSSSWDDYSPATKIQILRHERIHMRQSRKYGRVLFSFLYLMVPLPCGIAYFRKKFEMEAYEESLKIIHQHRGEKAFTPDLKEFYVSQFVSANYFWMWPFRKNVEAWYDGVVAKILSGN